MEDENFSDIGNLKGTETYKNVGISEDLTVEQRRQVIELLEEYQDIFTERPGITDLEGHWIERTTADPI